MHTYVHKSTHTHTHTYTRARAHTHKHTHTSKSITCILLHHAYACFADGLQMHESDTDLWIWLHESHGINL